MVVVIDADNTQLSKLEEVLREISTHGRIVVKRAYGNWQKDSLKNWEEVLKHLAIKAVQQFDYVSGKNATDMALLIDTLDLLYTHIYDAFVIVSSDSDYTPLAIKLHESGVYVMGVGEKKTPASFRNSCDEFLFLENLSGSRNTSGAAEEKPRTRRDSGKEEEIDGIDEIHALLRKAYVTYQDDDGFANMAPAGNFIKRAKPDFDCRTYGFAKLLNLLEAFPKRYEIRKAHGNSTVTAYRCR